MSKKYILQICAYAAPYAGNFISSLVALADACREKGYETIFAFPEKAQSKKWCRELAANYQTVFLPLAKARINPKTYGVLRRLFLQYDICIAHSHFELYDIPLSVSATSKTKQFWHLHDSIELIYNNNSQIRRLVMRMQYGFFGRNAKLLAVSRVSMEFAKRIGFNAHNAFYVPNGMDTTRLSQATLNRDKAKYDFLIFGWAYVTKGVDILVQVLNTGSLKGYTCAIVCDYETWNNEITKELKGPGSDSVVWVPPRENVVELYQDTRCFLHISRSEGLSYALMEAIYSGCVVISSDIEQNLFAKPCPTVHYIPVGDAEALASEMQRVVTKEYTHNSRDYEISRSFIDNNYSAQKWVDNVLNYYFEDSDDI